MTTPNLTAEQYEGLRAYLAKLPREQYSAELRFAQIEELIGAPLPAEASEYSWWHLGADGPRTPQSCAWAQAGFGISAILGLTDRSGGVSFVRGLHRWPEVCVGSHEFGQVPAPERLRQLAIGYLESGKLLCTHLGENPSELTWPRGAVVCFCYRHAVELFVKSCILHREPIEKCNHNISGLRKQYFKLYPQDEFNFNTLYDISLDEIEELLGGRTTAEDFERKEDQLYRYFSDKEGRSPRGYYAFAPASWLSMLEQLEYDMTRIWSRIRAAAEQA